MPQTIYKNSRVGAYAPIRKEHLVTSAPTLHKEIKSSLFSKAKRISITVYTLQVFVSSFPGSNQDERKTIF